jgi:hypothetical protein
MFRTICKVVRATREFGVQLGDLVLAFAIWPLNYEFLWFRRLLSGQNDKLLVSFPKLAFKIAIHPLIPRVLRPKRKIVRKDCRLSG